MAAWLSSLTWHPAHVQHGLDQLDKRRHEAMVARLEIGPAGVVTWDDDHGW